MAETSTDWRGWDDRCPDCGRLVAVRRNVVVLIVHGPRSARCPGSGKPSSVTTDYVAKVA